MSFGSVLAVCALAACSSSSVERSALLGRPAMALRGGFKSADELSDDVLRATYTCKEAIAEVLGGCDAKVGEMSKTLATGEPIPAFGEVADQVVAQAVESFDATVPKRTSKEIVAAAKAELTSAVHAKLYPVFLQQLQALKVKAISLHPMNEMSVQSQVSADQFFAREAAASVATGTGWTFESERTNLQTIMHTLERETKKGMAAKIQAAQQMATAMQFLQAQQAQMQQLQQQIYGGGAGKWNVGAAYRPPDSNINLSLTHQQGRTNIVASMVPDEAQTLLGANGFTNGVGPANLGVSFNINV
jgi:hypothetical protein